MRQQDGNPKDEVIDFHFRQEEKMDLAKVKEQKQMKAQAEEKKEVREIKWPDDYYSTTDADKRKELLEYAIGQELEPEKNKIRMELWEKRYGVKAGVDQFLAAWINLIYYSNMVKGKRIARWHKKEIDKLIGSMCFDIVERDGEAAEELLYLEFYHMLDFYMDICQTDKKYTGIILGLGTMSQDRVVQKIATEFFRVAYCVPDMIKSMKEYEIVRRAVVDCFAAKFPNSAGAIEELVRNEEELR